MLDKVHANDKIWLGVDDSTIWKSTNRFEKEDSSRHEINVSQAILLMAAVSV